MVENSDSESVERRLATQSVTLDAMRVLGGLGRAADPLPRRNGWRADKQSFALAAFRAIVQCALAGSPVTRESGQSASAAQEFALTAKEYADEAAFRGAAVSDLANAEAAESVRSALLAAAAVARSVLQIDPSRGRVSSPASTANGSVLRSSAGRSAVSPASATMEGGVSMRDLFHEPIWSETEEPEAVAEARGKLLAFLDAEPAVWGFWRRWYQAMFDGRPMDWELQRRVALIPGSVWEEGPEAVAAEIARIEAEFLARALPQAERAELDEETGKIRFVPIAAENPGLLGAILSQVEDALDDVLANPSNGLSERSREAKVLRRTIQRYGNDPQRIEMDLVSVHAGLTRQIVVEDLPPSEENLALQAAVEEGARGIRATHPEVAENRAILSQRAIEERPPEAVETIKAAEPVLVAISEPVLAREWAEDIAEIVARQTRPVVVRRQLGPAERNRVLAVYAEEVRFFSRVAKIGVLLRKTSGLIHRVDQSAGYKGMRIVTTVAALVALGISLF